MANIEAVPPTEVPTPPAGVPEPARPQPFEGLAREHSELRSQLLVGKHVTPETILDLVPASKEQTVYLSGPEPMVESVGAGLREHGVTLKQDWFPGYDEKTY